MGNRAPTRGKQRDTRDTLYNAKEGYGAMFHCVYGSQARMDASPKAKILLDDLIYQYRPHTNGGLVLCPNEKDKKDGLTVLERTGLSETSVYRAAAELEALGLIICTRRGDFTRRPSYYAITWAPLDKTDVKYKTVIGFEAPVHWWQNGPPDWQLKKLYQVSKYHQRAIEEIHGSQGDNQEGLTVVPETTANVQ